MRPNLVTVAELELMTPAEQDETFRRSIVDDPDTDDRIRPEFLAQVRARLEARLVAADESRSL